MNHSADKADSEVIADLMPQTPDLRAERLVALRKLFPDLFDGEGRLQEKELRALADPAHHPAAERYEFLWTGKARSKREAFKPSRTALVYDERRSVNPDMACGNVVIEGENLEVLKLLTAAYRERVKLIYIDPPYNTGKDFVYSDDYSEGRKPYWEESGVTERGVKVDTNSDSEGRYHSNWLTMIYSRLLAARYLLSPDGAIFVSIDEHELHNLRRVMDDVFGSENFVAQATVLSNPKGRSQDKYFATNSEYVLVYSRQELPKGSFAIEKDEDQVEAEYPEEDEGGKYRALELRNTHREFGRHNRPNLFYPFFVSEEGEITLKSGNGGAKVLPVWDDGYEGCWTWEKPKAERDLDFLEARKVKGEWKIFRKSYASGADRMVKTVIVGKAFTTERGQKEFNQLFATRAKVFQAPKPTALVGEILKTRTSGSDLILDFFGGSGTTAQAVMDLNAADGGKRRYILVQLPEFTKEDSAAFKEGYKKISDITIERSKRVIARYRKEAEGLPVTDPKRQHAESQGFKVYTLEKSNFPRVDFAPSPDKTEAENVELLKAYIREKESTFARTWDRGRILDEVLLKNGFMFDRTIAPALEFSKNRVEIVQDAHRTALVCLDESIAPETVDAFKGDQDRTFVCLEAALDTTKKWNLKHYLGDRLRAI